MKIRQLSIEGAWEITPQQHTDPRGAFMEWYRFDRLAEVVGHPLNLAQANLSISARNVVRGIHFADVPPGQAKYVTCTRGTVIDVIVDIRVGSPTFGRWEAVQLDDVERKAVYLSEGLGHGYCAVTDDPEFVYLCSTTYNPKGEHTVNPLDPELGIEWPAEVPILSPRDESAPSLAEAREAGTLPSYDTCRAYAETLRSETSRTE
ncbi:dTDP-4-dehydrorhamnose 3,5-epimerase [Phytohabitans flavus]|uniref:dTDP-4-dehydrorhamnose 3,5-epimerase n=1 Tax=Phytohabitans flavus TaxID=1076124 RepID=A0A6F8XTG3_9ACTN|nr:dTDP-4-dehydrorhamnose 3,5-epimerase family protein [Phytohabitans flavus]BCB77116.1 dTDP-4-dehydrorhamnose 3,5-epimerase [Phytohabitans flavus]